MVLAGNSINGMMIGFIALKNKNVAKKIFELIQQISKALNTMKLYPLF